MWTARSPVKGETTYDQANDQHLFFNGTDWVPFTLSASSSSGGGASADANTFLFISSAVGIMSRSGLGWINKTSGPNDTEESVSGSDWIRLRIPAVSGGGAHYSARVWSCPTGDKIVKARLLFFPDGLPSAPVRGQLLIRNPGNGIVLFGIKQSGSVPVIALARLNDTFGLIAESIILPSTLGFERLRIRVVGTTAYGEMWAAGVWQYITETSDAFISGCTECGLFIQRQNNADTVLFCDEFQVTT